MDKDELQRIAEKLESLEIQLRADYGLNRISGGFVSIDMQDFSSTTIYVSVKDGIQNDVTNNVRTETLRIDRKTLEFIN